MVDEKRGPAAWSLETRRLAAQILLREEKKLGLVSEDWVRRIAAGEELREAEAEAEPVAGRPGTPG